MKAERIPTSYSKSSDGQKWRKLSQRISLVIFILVIWGLLVIPIIFYYLPLPQVSKTNISPWVESLLLQEFFIWQIIPFLAVIIITKVKSLFLCFILLRIKKNKIHHWFLMVTEFFLIMRLLYINYCFMCYLYILFNNSHHWISKLFPMSG